MPSQKSQPPAIKPATIPSTAPRTNPTIEIFFFIAFSVSQCVSSLRFFLAFPSKDRRQAGCATSLPATFG
jgi:hypothetical protein